MFVLVVLVSYIFLLLLGFLFFAVIGIFWEVGLVKFWSAACPGKVFMECDRSQGVIDVCLLKLVGDCTEMFFCLYFSIFFDLYIYLVYLDMDYGFFLFGIVG